MPGRQQIPQEVPEKGAGMLLIELYASLTEIGVTGYVIDNRENKGPPFLQSPLNMGVECTWRKCTVGGGYTYLT